MLHLLWAKNWGAYFKKARSIAAGATIVQDWPTGSSSEQEVTAARIASQAASASGHVEHQHNDAAPPRFRRRTSQPPPAPDAYLALNTLLGTAAGLPLAYPVQIMPPATRGGPWFVRSDSQNRMLRDTYTLDPHNAKILGVEGFRNHPLVDRVVSIGISYHEGQLFGILNQALGLFAASGAVTLAISSMVMWWKRRPRGVLGAPVAPLEPVITFPLILLLACLAVAFPMLGASFILVAIIERSVLRRLPGVRLWLGLRPA